MTILVTSVCYAPITLADKNLPDTSIQNRVLEPFSGDLDKLKKRRLIRVLVSHTKTNFFMTRKGFRGIEYDLLKAYEKQLNRGPRKEGYKISLTFIPVPFSELLIKLEEGYGDIAASGITITPERELLVDFTKPYITNVDEVLISHKDSPPIHSIDDLAGKQVILVASSSYLINVLKINQQLGAKGLEPIEVVTANPLLEAEDLLELVNKKIYDYTVTDNHIALIWKSSLENIQIHDDIVFFKNANIAWATQKKQPQLKASLNSFIKKHAKPGRFLGNSVYKKYFKDSYWIKEPLTYDLLQKIDCLQYYFEYYGEFYGIDWHLIAALAYQESRFVQKKKSGMGAVGIMQIKPSTSRDKHVNLTNIHDLEENIHAGIKYLAFLKERYFSDDKYSEKEKINFALAAYNAGPTRLIRLKNEAIKTGVNPYKWFYHLETVARKRIGLETVNYVANIQKMRLFLQASHELNKSRQNLLAEKISDHAIKVPLN